MKSIIAIKAGIALALFTPPGLMAAETPAPAIAGLEEAAAGFVTAYNNRDASALAKLFTENGEMTDLSGTRITSGRAGIQARYEEIFAEDPLQIAIEVDSVRLVAPGLAIEDGTYHLTPADDENAPPRSTSYTAVLTRNEGGEWRIASTRRLKDVTEAAGHLAELAEVLKGEWTCRMDGVQIDLAYGWDESGKFLTGEMLTTTADAEPQQGTIRIGWDASKKSIVSWMFDGMGGATQGVWTPTDDGWLIRSEGTTAEGETLNATQQLTTEGAEALIWNATNRVIDGEKQPDITLRIVPQVPVPEGETQP